MKGRQQRTATVFLALLGAIWSAPSFGENLVANGGFDTNSAGWNWNPAIDYWSVAWSSLDADGSPASGSVAITFNPRYGFNQVPHEAGVLSAPVAVEAGRLYEVGAKVRLLEEGTVRPGMNLAWFVEGQYPEGDDPITQELAFTDTGAGTGWHAVRTRFRAPASYLGHSFFLELGMSTDVTPTQVSVWFDDVYVREVPEHSYLVSGVAHTHGFAGAYWVSDLTVFNPGPDATQVELSFKGSTAAGPFRHTIAGRQQLTIEDVLASEFGIAAEDVGVVTVASSAPVETHVRTYSRGVDPKTGKVTTFGQSYPGMEASQALPGTQLGFLSGLRSDGAYRSNLELVNAGDGNATVDVKFFDADGNGIGGDLSRTVGPGERAGVTAALPAGHASAYAELSLWPPESKVIAFGSVIDGTTNDPTTIAATIGPPVQRSPLDGVWIGSVRAGYVIQGGKIATGCVADYLSGVFGGTSPVQMSIQGTTLSVDAIGAQFGTCAPVELQDLYGDTVANLACDLGLPRDITCGDGSTWHLVLGGAPNGYGILEPTPEDSLNYSWDPDVAAWPGGGGPGTLYGLSFVFDLSRKH